MGSNTFLHMMPFSLWKRRMCLFDDKKTQRESLTKQHQGPASLAKAAAGELQVLPFGMSSLANRHPSCSWHKKRTHSTDRGNLAAHPLSGIQMTSKNK